MSAKAHSLKEAHKVNALSSTCEGCEIKFTIYLAWNSYNELKGVGRVIFNSLTNTLKLEYYLFSQMIRNLMSQPSICWYLNTLPCAWNWLLKKQRNQTRTEDNTRHDRVRYIESTRFSLMISGRIRIPWETIHNEEINERETHKHLSTTTRYRAELLNKF